MSVLGFAAAAFAPGQALAASSDHQLWTNAVINVKLDDKWKLQEELTGRFSDQRGGLYEIESNTLLGFRLNKTVTVWGGYTHDPIYSHGDLQVMEHRAREQVTFDNFATLGTGKFSGRLRMEQRWREGADGTGWRLRPTLRYSLPIAGKTAFVVSSEAFLNLNSTSFQTRTGADRMRNLVMITTPLGKKLNGEIGYLNQHGFVKHGPDTTDHVAYVGLVANL